ncbi:MAG: hypothetical protein ACLP1X_00390 [Polyangiaceae bacterium]
MPVLSPKAQGIINIVVTLLGAVGTLGPQFTSMGLPTWVRIASAAMLLAAFAKANLLPALAGRYAPQAATAAKGLTP